jgi:hypothetical protein
MTTFVDPTTGDPIITPCMKVDPETCFRTGPGDEAIAIALCARCPVTKQCLEFSQKVEREHGHGYKHGIWAGMNPSDRSKLTDRRVA